MFIAMLKLVATIELLILQKGASTGKALLAGSISFSVKFVSLMLDYRTSDWKGVLIDCIDAFATSALTTSLTFGLLSNKLGLFRNLWKESASKILQILKQFVAPAVASALYNFMDQIVGIAIVDDKKNLEIAPIVLSFFTTLIGTGLAGSTDTWGTLRLSWALSTISESTSNIIREVNQ